MNRKNKLTSILMRNITPTLLIPVLVMLVAVLALSSPFFLKWDNIRNILDQSTLNIIVGTGMTFAICAGGFDLSVGAVAALAGVIMALSMHAGAPVAFAVGAGVVLGLLAGLLNGGLVAFLRINPFIATLASMSVFRGLTLILTGGIPIYGFPPGFTWLGSGSVFHLPVPVILTAVVALAGFIILNKTKAGYYTLSLGGNEEALRRCGISTRLVKVVVYVLCGLSAALAGLVLTARLNSADPLAGYMMELDVIATVILGGTSIKGGRGTVGGTVLAGLLLAVIRNGLTIHGIASYYQQLALGLIILCAVTMPELRTIVGKRRFY